MNDHILQKITYHFFTGGTTFHSGVGFQWGPDHLSMTKEKLDKTKKSLEHVETVIVDEMSMVSADFLYNLHKRLMEIFDSKDDFGGRGLLLVGDLLQLPPVQATPIFKKPKSGKNAILSKMIDKDGSPIGDLWGQCEVVVLKTNFRQGEGDPWTELLNRVRIGEATKEDVKILASRKSSLLTKDQYNEATHVFFRNIDVLKHNTKMIKTLSASLNEIEAKYEVPKGVKYSPQINDWGIVGESNLSEIVQVKIGARVMLIYNVNIPDLLVNGSLGTVIGLEHTKGRNIDAIVVEFDHSDAGSDQMKEFHHISSKYSGQRGCPIFKITVEEPMPFGKKNRSKGKKHGSTYKITQFPLRLAWASTTHKLQGTTIKRGSNLVTHGHPKMPNSMYYVMLSRVAAMENVFNENFLPDRLTANESALKANADLEERDIAPSFHDIHFDYFVLNISSLSKHFIDLKLDNYAQNSDNICVVETWLDPEKHNISNFNIPEKSFEHVSLGRGKGCGVYSPADKNFTSINKVMKNNYQILSMTDERVQIVLTYLSSQCPIAEVVTELQLILKPDKKIIIMGDFNFDKSEKNPLTKYLATKEMVQLVKNPTHDKGRCLDHCYVPQELMDKVVIKQYSPYYSDHDALCISLNL